MHGKRGGGWGGRGKGCRDCGEWERLGGEETKIEGRDQGRGNAGKMSKEGTKKGNLVRGRGG